MNLNDGGPYIFHTDPNMSQGLGPNYLFDFCSFVDMTLFNSNHLISSGSLALQEAFSCISKFAGVLFLWLSSGSNSRSGRKMSGKISCGSNVKNYQAFPQMQQITTNRINLEGLHIFSVSDLQSTIPMAFSKLANSTARQLWKEFGQCETFPVLSLASVLIPPFKNLSAKLLSDSLPRGTAEDQISGHADPRADGHQVCNICAISDLTLPREVVEPITGIHFPRVLNMPLSGEVLVGIGFRNMKIMKFKSLKIYAFGLYVHFDSICEKLGRKYASVPINDLKDSSDFYEDLLREDIGLTVRLVVNYNGLKINTVKDAFEKSIRTRLHKMNPHTDFECLRAFGSYFTDDIPLPIGTTIDFRRSTGGQLITEIGGKHIGSVQSKDLCRAFFDMYIGDVPVSAQTKQEIAENVAGLIRRC